MSDNEVSGTNLPNEIQEIIKTNEVKSPNPDTIHPSKGYVSGDISKWKDEDPELWRQFLNGISIKIAEEMKKDAERLKKIMREGRQNG